MSNNCLITRLKAVVDDDTLPKVRIMEQFTLDAIAASGNQNMTTEQKWALNNFFYEIGAIDNSGLFNKIDHLFIPFISNDNLDYAFVDYKNNERLIIPDSSKEILSFRSKGVICVNENNNALTTIDTAYERYSDNMSIGVFCTEKNKTFGGFKNGDSTQGTADFSMTAQSGDTPSWIGATASYKLGSNPSSVTRYRYSGDDLRLDGFIYNCINQNINFYQYKGRTLVPQTMEQDNFVHYKTSPYRLRINIQTETLENTAAIGLLFVGAPLSESEITIIKDEVALLKAAFVN